MNAVKIGSNFATVNPTSMTTIVSPSDNTKGMYLQTATIVTSSNTFNVWAATSQPTAIGDISRPIIFGANGTNSGGANGQYYMPYPLFIPAGYGLYAMTNSSGGYMSLTWDLVA